MSQESMTSAKPYLIRAIYEWIADNELTPYINVDATVTNTEVPAEHVKNGEITLDISPAATVELLIDNRAITFKASFAGINQELYIPIAAVRAIYAPENGQGMSFPEDEYPDEEIESNRPKPKKSPFKVIDGGKDSE